MKRLLNWFRRSEETATEFESMKIVVGLGNPGTQYRGTRHNVGFDVVRAFVDKHAFGDKAKSKFNSNVNEVMVGTTKVVLLTPLTYMNLSGQAVQAAVKFFKLDLEDLMVICDDLNLEVGRIRIRAKGSAGGQNGIKDIINRLGTQEFSRLRLGIGRPPGNWNVADYVLGKPDELDEKLIGDSVKQAVLACEHWIANDIQAAMNRFNANPSATQKKKKRPAKRSDASDDKTLTD